jgi:predicted pyridoxine 5'-phosphate oxidase superfamily flavin-nucleotide-binding protein
MKNPYSSYHQGELAVQARAGVSSGDLRAEDMYRSLMPTGVQRCLATQQLAVLSSMDPEGRIWASMRSGPAGFLRAIDDATVEIGGYFNPDDPLLTNLSAHTQLGMVVIQLMARQRIRLNGTARPLPDGRILLTTRQVYGNCPQYIQARIVTGERDETVAAARLGSELEAAQQKSIERADTLFIATSHPEAGADASHRGGRPGFVCVENKSRLLIPDYSGNKMFNTLGNIEVYPRAGLLFPDFESGSALQLSGSARTLWDDARIKEFLGARRLLQFDIKRVIELSVATHLRFKFQSYSPTLPAQLSGDPTSEFHSCDAQSGVASPEDRSSPD